eukprot:scaffold25999_cov88-Cyclotella_meneghiniana.AAC.3
MKIPPKVSPFFHFYVCLCYYGIPGAQRRLVCTKVHQVIRHYAEGTLSRLDKDLYPGVVSLFRQGNTALLSETLPDGLETRLKKEDSLRNLQGEKSTQANVSFSQAGRLQHHLATHNATASVQPNERPHQRYNNMSRLLRYKPKG